MYIIKENYMQCLTKLGKIIFLEPHTSLFINIYVKYFGIGLYDPPALPPTIWVVKKFTLKMFLEKNLSLGL